MLAAAVSDFYLPENEMAEHKIQSSGDDLNLCLRPVPKLVNELKTAWASEGFCVSFKLETDRDLLISKATAAIEKYGVDLVVANLLETRYQEITLVAPPASNPQITVIKKPDQGIIEVPLCEFLLGHLISPQNRDE